VEEEFLGLVEVRGSSYLISEIFPDVFLLGTSDISHLQPLNRTNVHDIHHMIPIAPAESSLVHYPSGSYLQQKLLALPIDSQEVVLALEELEQGPVAEVVDLFAGPSAAVQQVLWKPPALLHCDSCLLPCNPHMWPVFQKHCLLSNVYLMCTKAYWDSSDVVPVNNSHTQWYVVDCVYMVDVQVALEVEGWVDHQVLVHGKVNLLQE
jgi:hypothetical protein